MDPLHLQLCHHLPHPDQLAILLQVTLFVNRIASDEPKQTRHVPALLDLVHFRGSWAESNQRYLSSWAESKGQTFTALRCQSPVGVTPRSFLPKVWVTPPGINDSLMRMFVPANVAINVSIIIIARVHSCTPHRHIVENEEPCRMKSKVSSSMQGSNEASVHPVVDSK